MSGLDNIARLQEEQEKSLQNCELMIEKWEKFQKDYIAVGDLLDELPKRTTHEVMVPIGPLAFMPGKLIHTNEIMVLLGDNWFAERSASQAVEITKRRLKNVEEYLSNLRKERENILSHMAFTADIAGVKGQNDIKEIKEELSEKDKRRLEQRSKRVAHAKAKKGSVKRVDLKAVSNNDSFSKDKDLFARLEELERQERLNKEMDDKDDINIPLRNSQSDAANDNKNSALANEMQGSDGTSFLLNKKQVTKTVKWKESLAEEKDTEKVVYPKDEIAVIKFTHSAGETIEPGESRSQGINSPADIFIDYLSRKAGAVTSSQQETRQPRSILKTSKNNKIEREDRILFKEKKNESPTPTCDASSLETGQKITENAEKRQKAFADLVVERQNVQSSKDSTKQEQHETRKVSKFKAGRMKNK